FVLLEVVDSVRDRLALGEVGEVVRVDLHGFAARLPLSAGVLEGADELLLLGVDRDRGLAVALELPDFACDVAELCVAIGVVGTLGGLAVGLEAEVELAQESADRETADRVTARPQLLREPGRALARPSQRRGRVATCCRINQGIEIAQELRVLN